MFLITVVFLKKKVFVEVFSILYSKGLVVIIVIK